MTQSNTLYQIFEAAAQRNPGTEALKEEVGYHHMMALADMYTEWTLDERLSPEQKAKCLGWAKGIRTMAEEVGPNWNPPHPKELSVLAITALVAAGERPPPPKPAAPGKPVEPPPRKLNRAKLIANLERGPTIRG